MRAHPRGSLDRRFRVSTRVALSGTRLEYQTLFSVARKGREEPIRFTGFRSIRRRLLSVSVQHDRLISAGGLFLSKPLGNAKHACCEGPTRPAILEAFLLNLSLLNLRLGRG